MIRLMIRLMIIRRLPSVDDYRTLMGEFIEFCYTKEAEAMRLNI